MAAQFDLYRVASGALVLVVQSDTMEDIATRVVCALVPDGSGPRSSQGLGPKVALGDDTYRVAPHIVATLTRAELGTKIGNLAHLRDDIIRAFDLLLTGT